MIQTEKIFRRVTKAGTVWGTEMTEKVWHVVREYAAAAGIATLAPSTTVSGSSRRPEQAVSSAYELASIGRRRASGT